MAKSPIREGKSINSNYIFYDDGGISLQSENGEEIPLEHPAYISDAISLSMKHQVSVGDYSKHELGELINTAPAYNQRQTGGRIVSIIVEDDKVGLRRSGVINTFMPG